MNKIILGIFITLIWNACVPNNKCQCDTTASSRQSDFVDTRAGSKYQGKTIAIFKFNSQIRDCYGTCPTTDTSGCIMLYSIQNVINENIDFDSLSINNQVFAKVTASSQSTTNSVNITGLFKCSEINGRDSIRLAAKNITFRP